MSIYICIYIIKISSLFYILINIIIGNRRKEKDILCNISYIIYIP